jgi:hypothetical protein
MARILRIELRRSVAPWAALLIAAVGVFVLFASHPPYRSWMELSIVQRDIMQLTWPLALAAGAWQGIRERRSRIEELLATTPRPRRWRVLPVAAALAFAAVAAYLVMFAGASGHLRHLDGYFSTGVVPIVALGALAMVAAAWFGLAIGSLLPSPLTAPMVFVIGFVGLAVLPPMLSDPDRRPGAFLLLPYLQGPRATETALSMLSVRANLAQALWLAAVASAGLALLAAARPAARVAALLPVLLGAAIAVPALPRQLDAAWVADHRATEVVCTSDEPRVCIARVHSHALDELRGPARQALAALAAKLPAAPTRVLVDDDMGPPKEPPPPDTLVVYLPLFDDVTFYADENLVWRTLDGAGVPPCARFLGSSEKNTQVRYGAARTIAAAWLLDRDVPPAAAERDPGQRGDERDAPGGRDGLRAGVLALARQALVTLRALPADEQQARVAALREAERTCADGDRLDLLTAPRTTR